MLINIFILLSHTVWAHKIHFVQFIEMCFWESSLQQFEKFFLSFLDFILEKIYVYLIPDFFGSCAFCPRFFTRFRVFISVILLVFFWFLYFRRFTTACMWFSYVHIFLHKAKDFEECKIGFSRLAMSPWQTLLTSSEVAWDSLTFYKRVYLEWNFNHLSHNNDNMDKIFGELGIIEGTTFYCVHNCLDVGEKTYFN